MLPLCEDWGVGVIPWSPLARGFLAGNRSRVGGGETARSKSDTMAHEYYYEEQDFEALDRVEEVAKEHGVKPAQVALAWLLHKPAVTSPIIGATKMRHLDEAIDALEISLSDEEIASMEEPYRPRRVMGNL